jgi:hypothetical protein
LPPSWLPLRGKPAARRILLEHLRERGLDPDAHGRLRVRPPRLQAGGTGGRAMSTVGAKGTGRRHAARGTGVLREILPYYRWGAAAGLLGAFVVAVFFLVVDIALGRPFATPTALGASLFLGGPLDLTRAPRAILVVGYTAVHGALFLGLALFATSMILGSREHPPRASILALILTGLFFTCLTLFFIAFALLTDTSLADAWRAGLVIAGNLLASAAMALLLTHALETRWHPESKLVPRQRGDQ